MLSSGVKQKEKMKTVHGRTTLVQQASSVLSSRGWKRNISSSCWRSLLLNLAAFLSPNVAFWRLACDSVANRELLSLCFGQLFFL